MRNYNLDLIRVIAMTGVLLDHFMWFFNSNTLSNSGLALGGVSNEMFFAISAFIFGLKWKSDGYAGFPPIKFLKNRCLRIFIPVWILLLFVIPLEYIVTGHFVPQTILFNIVGLGWARPFGVSGHLWFITMLMILYVSFMASSYIRLDKLKSHIWIIALVVIIAIYSLLYKNLNTYSKSGPILFLYFGLFLFAKGDSIMKWVQQHKTCVAVTAVLSVCLSFYIHLMAWNGNHNAMAYGSTIVAGFLLFICLYTCLQIKNNSKYIDRFSNISYEIYLVHIPIIALARSLTDNSNIQLLLSLALTFVLSVCLNNVSKRITRLVLHK